MNSASNWSIKKLHDIQPGEHLCILYKTDAEHRQILTSFIINGLECNHKIIYIIDTRTIDTIQNYLKDKGINPKKYIIISIIFHQKSCWGKICRPKN